MTNNSGALGDLASLKSLARVLAEEGRLAEMENRYSDAARSYLDASRFGNEMSWRADRRKQSKMEAPVEPPTP